MGGRREEKVDASLTNNISKKKKTFDEKWNRNGEISDPLF